MTTPTSGKAKGTGPFYLVAFVCSLLSLDTAARFFSQRMGIDGLPIHGISVELAAVCGVGELTLIACGYAMRHNVRRENGKPGAAQLVALTLCSAATFMAIALDGPVAGALRAFFGPVLALIALHLALGIEVKVRAGINTGVWARIAAEIRERLLSRIGLGDDERKAAERTRDRARERAARLATATGWVPWRTARLVRAVRKSGATLDVEQRWRLVEQVAALRSISDLVEIDMGSPWASVAAQRAAQQEPAPAATDTAPAAATGAATTPLQPSSALMGIDPQLAAIVRNGRGGSTRNGEARNGRNAQVSAPTAPSAADRSDTTFMAIVAPLVARSLDATGAAPSQRSVRNAIEAKVQPAPGFKKVGELIQRATEAHRERSERAATDDADRSDDPDRDRINGRTPDLIGATS